MDRDLGRTAVANRIRRHRRNRTWCYADNRDGIRRTGHEIAHTIQSVKFKIICPEFFKHYIYFKVIIRREPRGPGSRVDPNIRHLQRCNTTYRHKHIRRTEVLTAIGCNLEDKRRYLRQDVRPTVANESLDAVPSAGIAPVGYQSIRSIVQKPVEGRRRVPRSVRRLPAAVHQFRERLQVHPTIFGIIKKLIDLRELARSDGEQARGWPIARSECKVDVPGHQIPLASLRGVVEVVVLASVIPIAVPVAHRVANSQHPGEVIGIDDRFD